MTYTESHSTVTLLDHSHSTAFAQSDGDAVLFQLCDVVVSCRPVPVHKTQGLPSQVPHAPAYPSGI